MRLKLILATLPPSSSLGSTRAPLGELFLRPWPNEILHRQYNYSSAKSNAIVEVVHVIIEQPDAATRGAFANASRIVGAVDAISVPPIYIARAPSGFPWPPATMRGR